MPPALLGRARRPCQPGARFRPAPIAHPTSVCDHEIMSLAIICFLALLCACPQQTFGRLLLEGESPPECADASSWNYEEICPAALSDFRLSMPAFPATGPQPAPVADAAVGAVGSASSEVGFQTGGAQDIENFRENIEADFLPLPTDLTYEGIVKSYYFNTSSPSAPLCADLFCPTYSLGLSPDPLLNKPQGSELYLAIGLDSSMTAADAARRLLNLVVVLDVSGSMGSPFDSYYYDNPAGGPAEDELKPKMEVAKEVLTGIVGLLAPKDQLGIVLFSDGACTPLPLTRVSCLDRKALKRQIGLDVTSTSGTNFQAGIDAGGKELTGCVACMESNKSEVENRIIFITDAQPNAGDTSEEGLLARIKALAADGIYTTMIGVGLDFNTELVEKIIKVRGANYFSVHTPGEFKQRLVDEFDYAVTPLVFDLSLKVGSSSAANDSQGGPEVATKQGWQILHVYGSPNPNETALSSDGTIMRVHTLFPSPKTEEGIKGGVVLLRMKPPADAVAGQPLQLQVSYENREGERFSSALTVELPSELAEEGAPTYFESSGVQKAVALARFVDILHTWLLDEWMAVEPSQPPVAIPEPWCLDFPASWCPWVEPAVYNPQPMPNTSTGSSSGGGCWLEHWLLPDGCILPPPWPVWPPLLGRWERRSEPLSVGQAAQEALLEFLPYFEGEVAAVGDASMDQEVELLKKLITL